MTWEDKSALSMERALLRALRDLHATKAASFNTVPRSQPGSPQHFISVYRPQDGITQSLR